MECNAKRSQAKDNGMIIWNFLKNAGLNDYAAAGIMGNLHAESCLNPRNLQNSFEKRLGFTDDSYTAAVDSGAYENFIRDSAGYGLAQWTYWSRKEALYKYAKSRGKSIGDMGMQLEFFWEEIQGYKSVMDVLNKACSVEEASNAVLHGYEKPGDQSRAVEKVRASYGQMYYDRYAGNGGQEAPGAESGDNTGTGPSGKELYRVQCGAFNNKANAERRMAELKAAGFDAIVVKV